MHLACRGPLAEPARHARASRRDAGHAPVTHKPARCGVSWRPQPRAASEVLGKTNVNGLSPIRAIGVTYSA